MKLYWVLGKLFDNNHDRAIRYIDLKTTNKVIKNDIPKEDKIRADNCDRCNCYHIIREA